MTIAQIQRDAEFGQALAALSADGRINTLAAKGLTGHQRAAILMLTLGDKVSARIWKLLDDDEIRVLSIAMSQLGTVEPDIVESLMLEFVGRLSAAGGLMGNFDATERLLSQFMPTDRVAMLMEEIRGPAGRNMWEKLSNVQEQVLANYLKNEYPQTVAVVLSKVKPDHAARVLAILPEGFAMEVVMRMLRMENVQKEALDGVERTLKMEFMSNLARTQRRDAHEMMANIFNGLDRQAEARLMAALEERNFEAAERIRSLMFTFDDLKRLDPAGLQLLLRSVEKERLTLALKGAAEEMRDLFFRNMTERAAKLLRDDIAALGPVRLKDVDEAQAAVVAAAKDLAAQGQIQLSEGKDDQLVE